MEGISVYQQLEQILQVGYTKARLGARFRPEQFLLLQTGNHCQEDSDPYDNESNCHGAPKKLQSSVLKYVPHDLSSSNLKRLHQSLSQRAYIG